MKRTIERANSPSTRTAYESLRLVASLAENLPPDTPDALGFFNHFLFLARKAATNEAPDVRQAVSAALAALARRSPDWREAVIETCEEIAGQPSTIAKQLASQTLNELAEKKSE